MLAETCCKVKAALCIAMLAVAKVRQGQLDILLRHRLQSRSSASNSSDRDTGSDLVDQKLGAVMSGNSFRIQTIRPRETFLRGSQSLEQMIAIARQLEAKKTVGFAATELVYNATSRSRDWHKVSHNVNEMMFKVDKSVDDLVDKLCDQELKASPARDVRLDATTFGKSGHLATSSHVHPRYTLPRRTSSRSTHVDSRLHWASYPRMSFNRASASPKASEDAAMNQQLSSSLGGDALFNRGDEAGSALPDTVKNVFDAMIDETSSDGDKAVRLADSVQTAALDSILHDLVIFLACTCVAIPLATSTGITSILTYLGFGALLGPNGLDVFTSSKADVELGDFGILFLLFSEGLEVSSERFAQLASYLPLGFAQISLTTGALCAVILGGVAQALEKFLPLDDGLINVNNPSEALVLALAGTLSTSAFVFPVLKERGWEEQDVGKAATSILLLQDLFVAPLLVLLPFIVGQGGQDIGAMAEPAVKAAVGFSSVLVVGSFLLRKFFDVIAVSQSEDIFVASSLLVAVVMGAVAKSFGLTDTAGAFAAGVLLANTNYKYEIQASIKPIREILLGVFFVDAGTNFDPELLIREASTVATGVTLLLLIKAVTLWLVGRVTKAMPGGAELSSAGNLRLALLLAGGGEFAFVVLAGAEKLGALPDELNSLLTTVILISMAITPLLGTAAATLSESLAQPTPPSEPALVASDAVVICGYSEVGRSVRKILAAAKPVAQPGQKHGLEAHSANSIACFAINPAMMPRGVQVRDGAVVTYGDASNPDIVRGLGITAPRAIFVTYPESAKRKAATQRLHAAFPTAPIYVRATSREEREELLASGASTTILESQEVALQLSACLFLGEDSLQLYENTQADGGQVAGWDLNAVQRWEASVRALRAIASSNSSIKIGSGKSSVPLDDGDGK